MSGDGVRAAQVVSLQGKKLYSPRVLAAYTIRASGGSILYGLNLRA
jgi:hypothetical protein